MKINNIRNHHLDLLIGCFFFKVKNFPIFLFKKAKSPQSEAWCVSYRQVWVGPNSPPGHLGGQKSSLVFVVFVVVEPILVGG